ncbi:hypothetical protein LCGC14_1567390 [marine sediment metagenome]|uniref:Uncharacterized protein n=1 Tax=marine sediment metagenome TaxID=412755 RepID=A0A0F9LL82_9ZZZZ
MSESSKEALEVSMKYTHAVALWLKTENGEAPNLAAFIDAAYKPRIEAQKKENEGYAFLLTKEPPMQTKVYKDCVEFRERTTTGVRVVRVTMDTITPMVTCFTSSNRTDAFVNAPMAIYWDELERLVNRAKNILKGGNDEE